jgi:lipopolysaccharide cholinephosphotransferase
MMLPGDASTTSGLRVLQLALPLETNTVLVYGRATRTGKDTDEKLGHVDAEGNVVNQTLDNISFSLKNRILLRVTHLIGLPFSYRWKAKRYEKVSTRVKSGNDLHMSNGAFELMTHVWHPEQFAEKIRVPFEGVECLIPKKYDEVLTVLFGPDYMTPPPVEERVAKHLDL